MGLLKFAAKVAGSAALVATGVASTIFERASEMSGNDAAAGYAAAGREKSFEMIKNLWASNDGDDDELLDESDAERVELQKEISRYRSEISTLKSHASAAKKAGNEEKYSYYMERIDDLKGRIEALKEES